MAVASERESRTTEGRRHLARSSGRERPASRALRSRHPARRARLAGVGMALAAITAVGAYAGIAAGGSTTPRPAVANGHQRPASALHAVTIAYVGSSPTLAVTKLPPGYTLASSSHVSGPTKGLPGQEMWSKTFTGPGQITVEEVTGGGGTPKAVGLATQNPQAVQHVNVGGHPALLLDMNLTQGLPSAPAAHIVGYIVYWPVSSNSWAMVSGGASPADLELVAAGVVPAG
jgi:hypothetical protein